MICAGDLLAEVPLNATEEDFRITDARFLPIVSAYAQKIGLVEVIDRLLDCDIEVSLGRVVLAMILDALSGRSPRFRLKEWLEDHFQLGSSTRGLGEQAIFTDT